ncbi:hypothetical protein CAEBREN_20293 [Caenorhabditis brenneri]|uniref:G-protein coupled receptors family 1 profile domain-containing protein n=1 Tax=Caenorhabditis brenneri TaxID=135651 RepID=G0N347_CAEBE|nr:hypothetical protein CAEBREN_20293 [Caenorhabditis brenneri]
MESAACNSTSLVFLLVKLTMEINQVISKIFYFSAYVFIFPAFVAVFQSMREKEKKTAVYPIINHFYQATCFTYPCFLLYEIIIRFLTNKMEQIDKQLVGSISDWGRFLLSLIVTVHLTILSLLAIQRFLLYFYQRFEKYVTLTKRNTNFLLAFLYLIVFLESIIVKAYFDFIGPYTIDIDVGEKIEVHIVNRYEKYILFKYLSIYAVFIASSILYVPILLSIRKHSRLQSVVKNRPHQYILYQTLLGVIFKYFSLKKFH